MGMEFSRETARGRAAANVVASVILCVITVAIGHLIAAYFNDGATQIAKA